MKITTDDAIECVTKLLQYLEENTGYSEFEDDLYSLLDALNEDKKKE